MSTSQSTLHTAVIMDGNGRWAQQRGLPRLLGHYEGERNLHRIVDAAPKLGIKTLTVYAFSADNWRRPQPEVEGLMLLLETHLRNAVKRCLSKNVRITVIGRRDRIPVSARRVVDWAEAETRHCDRLHLRIAVDYSSRDALLAAAQASPADRDAFSSALGSPDVDLLIRTGAEQRLSDFLLWESAYAELYFTSCLWPDFGPAQLAEAVQCFHQRDRRFGGLNNLEKQYVPEHCPL